MLIFRKSFSKITSNLLSDTKKVFYKSLDLLALFSICKSAITILKISKVKLSIF